MTTQPTSLPSAPGRQPNPPGRSSLAFRVVRQAAAKRAMLAALSARPELAALTSRDDDDPVVALVDAWAAALDVLAFYSERIVDEGFLATATETGSVLQLARAIGYELRPGVAATTWLAFTVSETPGAPDDLPVPMGTRVQSVPGAGELPQTFETVEAIDARPEWNEVPVAAASAAAPKPGEGAVRVLGDSVVLAQGDPVVVLDGPGRWWDVRRVLRSVVVPAVQQTPHDAVPIVPAHTLVTLDAPIVARPLPAALASGVVGKQVHVLRQRAALFGFNAQPWDTLPVALRVGELDPGSEVSDVGPVVFRALQHEVPRAVEAAAGTAQPLAGTGEGASLRILTGAYSTRKDSWADAAFAAGTASIFLDQVHPKVVAGSLVVLERDGAAVLAAVSAVAEIPRADFGIATRSTRLTLVGGDAGGFSPRTANVLAQSEQLALAPVPLTGLLASTNVVVLARPVPDPGPGRTVVVSGFDGDGIAGAEVATVRSTSGPSGTAAGVTTLTLTCPLTGSYQPASARVLLNVAKATHGESRAEVLGSGDQRQQFQSFRLRQKPLTYVVAATSTGTRSTLAVWVGGVRWHEVASLHDQAADARVYTVRRADDGTVNVTFGDGVTGARLPTGRDNVVATYRVGIGLAADLGPGRLTLPLSRPLGLFGVSNPVDAAGADDPEPLDHSRRNVPLTVRSLGRIVSADDYEDFARAYAGVGKARADVLWDGERRLVHLTVTGPAGAPLAAGTRQALLQAVDDARHPTTPVLLASRHDLRFGLTARLLTDPDRRVEDVVAAAGASVLARWSFDRQELAASVTSAQVVALLQGVPGVVAVLLDEFHAVGSGSGVATAVLAQPARRVGAQTLPADLLTVDPTAVDLRGGNP